MRRLGHSIAAKFTVNGMPIAIASWPAAANASELTAALNDVHVVPLELGVVPVGRVAERRAEHLPVPERRALDRRGELVEVLLVALGIGLGLVLDDRADHVHSFVGDAGERIASSR